MLLRLFWAQKSWTERTFLCLTQELIAWHLENALIHILILKLQGYIFLRWQLPQFYRHPNKEILFSKHSPFIVRLRNFTHSISLCIVKCWWLVSLITAPTSSTFSLKQRFENWEAETIEFLAVEHSCFCVLPLSFCRYEKQGSWNKYLKLLYCLILATNSLSIWFG